MDRTTSRVPEPAEPPAPGELPRTLTFVLSAEERAGVLRVLRRYSSARAEALRLALGLGQAPPAGPSGRKGRGG